MAHSKRKLRLFGRSTFATARSSWVSHRPVASDAMGHDDAAVEKERADVRARRCAEMECDATDVAASTEPAFDALKEAGRTARAQVRAIDLLAGEMRLTAFRRYLHASVGSMSELVPPVLAAVGSDVATALLALRPSRQWPAAAGTANVIRARPGLVAFGRSRGRMAALRLDMQAPPERLGNAVVSEGGLADWVEVTVAGPALEVAMRSEAFELSTSSCRARIRLAGRLPDTYVAAILGRSLDDVVEHPIVRGRGYVVTAATHVDGGTLLEFEVGAIPLEMPWP